MSNELPTSLPDWLPELSYEVLESAAALLTDTDWLTMAAEEFDLDEAGAYILGIEMANILSPEVYSLTTQTIGHADGGRDRLASNMQQYFTHSFGRTQRICHQLIDGFTSRLYK